MAFPKRQDAGGGALDVQEQDYKAWKKKILFYMAQQACYQIVGTGFLPGQCTRREKWIEEIIILEAAIQHLKPM